MIITEKNSYTEGDTIVISGHIENHWEDYPALLHVDVAQRGSLLPFEARIDGNGDFQTQITAGGPEWITEGTYTVGVMHVAGSFSRSAGATKQRASCSSGSRRAAIHR